MKKCRHVFIAWFNPQYPNYRPRARLTTDKGLAVAEDLLYQNVSGGKRDFKLLSITPL